MIRILLTGFLGLALAGCHHGGVVVEADVHRVYRSPSHGHGSVRVERVYVEESRPSQPRRVHEDLPRPPMPPSPPRPRLPRPWRLR